MIITGITETLARNTLTLLMSSIIHMERYQIWCHIALAFDLRETQKRKHITAALYMKPIVIMAVLGQTNHAGGVIGT